MSYVQNMFTLVNKNEARFNNDSFSEEKMLMVTYFELDVTTHVNLPIITIFLSIEI